MKTIRICSGCGLPVAPDAPAGLCPECLLKSEAPSAGASGDATKLLPQPVPGGDFGSYRIIRLLGHGGMGRVYEAEHAGTGRRVALKVIGQSLASEEERLRFLREGRLAASVNHPNVVYIHGSEEVQGVPVIAMELVHGGTLKDRLKREGPLPVADAVAAMVEVIDGLEAAHHAGILHRDIKPANCFVTAEGAVKVGDFGLSVSTLARGESILTATGAVMGTPTYASPEQLRGEDLDVRSDIYSVGATLYHLLTGNTPFTAKDFVKLITEVLDKTPQPPRAVRPEIPAELSRVVLRCLAKDRDARLQSYAELREALLPFCQTERVPAARLRRFSAGFIDDLLAYGPCLLFTMYWSLDPLEFISRERTLHAVLLCLPFYVFYVLYYTICEGLWGAGIGKAMRGLRVVDQRNQAPGLVRALGRILIYMTPFTLPPLIAMAFVSKPVLLAELARQETRATDWLWIPLTVLLFITMRRRNEYAALQDLLTGTRVVVRPRTQVRPRLAPLGARAGNEAANTRMASVQLRTICGPYEVKELVWEQGGEKLLLGVDPVLRRNIWIHVCATGGDGSVATPRRRDLSRPARLRWLNHGIVDGAQWDAYEAPAGAAFLEATGEPLTWKAVRFWLMDLSDEIAAGEQDPSTAASLGLDRLWAASSGRLLVLDFPARPASAGAGMGPVAESGDAQAFLASVAERALRGGSGRKDVGIPIYAQKFLATLQQRGFDSIDFVRGNLNSLLTKPPEVSRSLRVATLAVVPVITLLTGLLIAGAVMASRFRTDRTWSNLFPGQPSLRMALDIYESAVDGDAQSEGARHAAWYISHYFRGISTNESIWMNPDLSEITTRRPLFDAALAQAPAGESTEFRATEAQLLRKMQRNMMEERMVPLRYVLKSGVAIMVISWGVTLATLLAIGELPILRLFGIAVVDARGRRARRGRLLWRSILTWSATGAICWAVAILMLRAFGGGMADEQHAALRLAAAFVVPGAMALLLGVVGWAAWHSDRGLQDDLAGTRLVPR